MLFKKALVAAFVAFTACATAAPTPAKGAGKASVPAKAVAKAPVRAKAAVKAPAPPKAAVRVAKAPSTRVPEKTKAGSSKALAKAGRFPVKYVKRRANPIFAHVPRALDEDLEEQLARRVYAGFEDYLESRELEDLWSDLFARANPTAANAMTFYRAVSGAEVASSKAAMGGPPPTVSSSRGDFSINGGYYMFADLASAEMIAADKLSFDPRTPAAILTLRWIPPPGLVIKRWEAVNDEWRAYVTHCNPRGGNAPHAIQTSHHLIEGPMSYLTGRPSQRQQYLNTFQYMIPSNAFNAVRGGLTIMEVTDYALRR